MTKRMKAFGLDDRGLLSSCPNCGQTNRLLYERLGKSFRCGKCHSSIGAPDEPLQVTSEAVFDALWANSALPVLTDFWASWCGPCKMVAPELAKVAAEGAGQWLVAKVNTEELPELARRFRISAIPTLAVFSHRRELARQSGALPAARIRQFVEQAALAERP